MTHPPLDTDLPECAAPESLVTDPGSLIRFSRGGSSPPEEGGTLKENEKELPSSSAFILLTPHI